MGCDSGLCFAVLFGCFVVLAMWVLVLRLRAGGFWVYICVVLFWFGCFVDCAAGWVLVCCKVYAFVGLGLLDVLMVAGLVVLVFGVLYFVSGCLVVWCLSSFVFGGGNLFVGKGWFWCRIGMVDFLLGHLHAWARWVCFGCLFSDFGCWVCSGFLPFWGCICWNSVL